jgi:hypothetical protein
LRCVSPSGKVECLETAEGERVRSVIEQEAVLTLARPTIETVLQLAEDIGKIRKSALLGFENVRALNSIPELALLS